MSRDYKEPFDWEAFNASYVPRHGSDLIALLGYGATIVICAASIFGFAGGFLK